MQRLFIGVIFFSMFSFRSFKVFCFLFRLMTMKPEKRKQKMVRYLDLFLEKNSCLLFLLNIYSYNIMHFLGAFSAMQSQVKLGKVRTPTDAWSGFGFSNSMPEAAIKELVSKCFRSYLL